MCRALIANEGKGEWDPEQGKVVNIQTHRRLTIQDHQTQHLTIQDHRAVSQLSGGEIAGVPRALMIEDSGPHGTTGTNPEADSQSAESHSELAGMVSNTRRSMAATSAPYGKSEIRD
jgi:hypothetical protein